MNIGYIFKNKELLDIAMTHISFANEKNIESNQRLEFLGDSVLSLIVSEYIYKELGNFDEGKLTEIRAAAVCERSLAEAAKRMDLGRHIKFGRSESEDGLNKPSILCDTYEAVLGAIYLDGGMNEARKWVMTNLSDIIRDAEHMDFHNYKSEIQNYFQKRDKGTEVVTYNLLKKSGPDHNPEFSVEAVYKGNVIGKGVGKSRKTAEQEAAKFAIEKLGVKL